MNQKESSVLFSLKELMTLEEDRVRHEEELEKRAGEAIALRQREEQDRRAREDEARMRTEAEERRQAEQRKREADARVDAIHQAEMERARLDAENSARLEQMTRLQAHETELLALNQDRGKKRLRAVVAGTIALLVVAIGVGGFVIHGQAERQRALEAQLSGLESDRDTLQHKIDGATTPEDRAALQAQLDLKDQQIKALQTQSTQPQHTATTPTARPQPTVRTTATATATVPCAKDFDPLNPCLR
ncbi:hypothetical protein BH09MYX1_BH09MYX1_28780 [soil metagenome]